MRKLFSSLSGQSGLGRLLAWTTGICLGIFLLLQIWRPCYFLTDDNLSGNFPIFTEMGRHLKAGETPFISQYLFGGNYNFLRDLDTVAWHPFILVPALLADTFARFWIVDIAALLFLVLTSVGFTLLAHSLREELSLKIPDAYLIFYTTSFVFSTYILTVGPSWFNFLGSQSSLPWLVLGILDRKVWRGTMLVLLFTCHEFLAAYAPLTVSTGVCLTVFAIGAAVWRRSLQPLFCWMAGSVMALLVLFPMLFSILNGFAHSDRVLGLLPSDISKFSIPAITFPFSFFMGNWSEAVAIWCGDKTLDTLNFPYLSSILACPAAWCLLPVLFARDRWQPLGKLCLGLVGILVIFIIRPDWLEVVLYHVPFFRSMRWPFREGMQFLFFVHLLLVIQFPNRIPYWQPTLTVCSLMVFVLPLPFIRVPTLNALFLDRQLLFSGEADRFWAGVKTQLKPSDQIATILDPSYLESNCKGIPYSVLGTANFPSFFRIRCVSGYSPTAPLDQMPLKTYPIFWFGAFSSEQTSEILAELPNLKLIRIESTHPLKITMSSGAGPEIDLTPYLDPEAVKESAARSVPQSGH